MTGYVRRGATAMPLLLADILKVFRVKFSVSSSHYNYYHFHGLILLDYSNYEAWIQNWYFPRLYSLPLHTIPLVIVMESLPNLFSPILPNDVTNPSDSQFYLEYQVCLIPFSLFGFQNG
jgi:hypothetical protein